MSKIVIFDIFWETGILHDGKRQYCASFEYDNYQLIIGGTIVGDTYSIQEGLKTLVCGLTNS